MTSARLPQQTIKAYQLEREHNISDTVCHCRRTGGGGHGRELNLSLLDSRKLITDTGITKLRCNTRHYPHKSRLRILDRPRTLHFLLTQCLLFEMAASVNSPPITQQSSVVIPPIYSPPPGEPPRRYRSRPSTPLRPLSTYSNDTTRRDNTGPYSFPQRPVFSREGTSYSITSSKTEGLHSRTHSVEFLVAHDRSSRGTSQPPPMLQVQSEFFWFNGRPCFVVE
jgi:hypothetical protein